MTVLFEKLASIELMNLARCEGMDSQLNKWKKDLPMIQAVLADAAQKHITQRVVELWLHDLQDLAYDIDDVLDDLATEVMKRKFQQSHATTSTSKLLKIIPTCCTNFTHNIRYARGMSSKVDEITTKLQQLVDRKNNLGLDVNVKADTTSKLREQTSLVDVSRVMGREADKEELLGKLLGEDACKQNVSVVPIVGLGGIGKTTLAKLLYNDEKVKDHFKLRAWVCVSDEFDVFYISMAIYQAVGGKVQQFATLDLLHVALKEKLSKKRFLIVLDDVWNEDHMQWELLQCPFVVGAPGSKIIITTRKTKVALVMNSFEPYILKVLPNEIALSLFAKYALDEQNFDKHPSLKLIAQGIIEKCDGLPLALITLGRVLKTKGNDEWEDLLNSQIWNLQDENDILPALKLSYYDLPRHLKQLFAYCSLFPKDYKFDKNKLVLLWMAEGFLSQSKDKKSMESLGRQYFEELQSRSFFQRSTNDESRYTMHDLMTDLAISVAGEFFFMLDDKTDQNGRVEAFEKFRHFSFIRRHVAYKKFKEIHRATCLRTFLPLSLGWQEFNTLDKVLVELLPRLQFLRVLRVTNYSITQVPQSIGSLKHLRYLNFSKTSIKRLPEEVSDLYNLQSLLVRYWYELTSLPESFVKLINLRHLDIFGTPLLNKMPRGIGGLTNLRTLSKVCIEATNGFKLPELKGLLDLEGQLSIKGLDKVIDPRQAKDANLEQKKGLEGLHMEWSDIFDDSRNSMIEYEVLERLRPPAKLTTLMILFYGGIDFPSWVGDPSFDRLTKLTLIGCRCTHLPTLGHLSSLRYLSVSKLHEVKIVDHEFLAPTKPFQAVAFPSLEYISVYDMQGLEIWCTSGDENNETARLFPHLRDISIQQCPKLVKVSFGLMPSLKVLHIKGCSVAVLRAIVGMSSSILRLTMLDIKGLTQLHKEILRHLVKIENLSIEDCDELRYLWESESEACKFLVRLHKLNVGWCNKLVSLAKKEVNVGNVMESVKDVCLRHCLMLESYSCPNSVERLTISNCCSMTSLTFSTLHELPSSSNIIGKDFCFLNPNFRLIYLQIYNCKNLKSIPHEHLQSFTSLEELEITYCPSMDYSFPCGLWPPNLKSLTTGCLNKPMSNWGLQNFPTSLVHLELYGENSGVVSFAVEEEESNTTSTSTSFLLPLSLSQLIIHHFKELESLSEVLQHLTRLEQLHIVSCPNLIHLPETTSSLRVEGSLYKHQHPLGYPMGLELLTSPIGESDLPSCRLSGDGAEAN